MSFGLSRTYLATCCSRGLSWSYFFTISARSSSGSLGAATSISALSETHWDAIGCNRNFKCAPYGAPPVIAAMSPWPQPAETRGNSPVPRSINGSQDTQNGTFITILVLLEKFVLY